MVPDLLPEEGRTLHAPPAAGTCGRQIERSSHEFRFRWREIPHRARRRIAAAGDRRHQRQPRPAGQARRLPGDLSVRWRRRRRIARPARSGYQHARRRADRRAPHHRRLRPAADGRHRHRLRSQRVQHRAHGEVADQGRRGGLPHRGPGRRQALRPSPGQGNRVGRRDGRPREGGRRCEDRSGFLPDRAHRRHPGRRRGRRHRARHRSRQVPTVSSPRPPTTCPPISVSSMR